VLDSPKSNKRCQLEKERYRKNNNSEGEDYDPGECIQQQLPLHFYIGLIKLEIHLA
jgi:hypothetical protein